ncbi:MAG TPA: RluA family pseudouridine synthase [Virgibacillus sp.]|nr:RluA family pseudouridine synthase [Virgibacillus sp.]
MNWKIGEEHAGMLVRDYLQTVQAFSRRMTKAVKFSDGIVVNNSPKTVRYTLSAGDILRVQFPPEEKGALMKPDATPISIIYEDEDILVIDKSPGMATIPSFHHPSGTIANGVLGHYEKHQIPYTVHVVTRLDRDTSGLLLIAKHRYSHSLLSASQKAGKVRRKYQAVTEGHLQEKEGSICLPIGRKEGSIIERTVTDAGKPAITAYQVIAESAHHSLVDIELETGRTHQIRVHFSAIGHALAGDDLYGGSTEKISRQALHCCELQFEHPGTKEIISFQSQVPADMKQIMFEP